MKENAKIKHGKLLGIALAIILICTSFAGCDLVSGGLVSEVVATGEFPVTVGTVEIPSKPSKVFVASANLADVVIALGKETQLVGATNECTQREIGSLTKLDKNDADAIKELSPEYILVEPLENSELEILSGVANVIEIDPAESREDFERLYAQISSIFSGRGAGYDAGISAARKIFISLDDVSRLTQSVTEQEMVKTGCYLYDTEGKAVTGEMFGSIILKYSGATNVFNSQTGGAYDFDTLKISNPDVIFCSPSAYDSIMSDSNFAQLQAVKDKKVYELDETYMTWQGRTVITAASTIAGYMYPELLEETSKEAEDPTESIESEVSKEVKEEKEEQEKYTTLQKGDDNSDVLKLQEKLDELGYLTAVYDGFYGDYTKDAIIDFQKNNSLEETGIADSKTQAKLYGNDAVKKPE